MPLTDFVSLEVRIDSWKVRRVLNVALFILFVYLVAPVAASGRTREVNVVRVDRYNDSVVQVVSIDLPDFQLDDCCSNNGSYCRKFGSHCQCQQDDSGCRCICPSDWSKPALQDEASLDTALDYTVRLAAGIAIVLLIGVSTMLAISLYRRAVLSRRNSRNNAAARERSESAASSGESSVQDSPPRYSEVFAITAPPGVGPESDFDKLPTYEEALQRLQSMSQDPRVSLSLLSTIESEIQAVTTAKAEDDKVENETTQTASAVPEVAPGPEVAVTDEAKRSNHNDDSHAAEGTDREAVVDNGNDLQVPHEDREEERSTL